MDRASSRSPPRRTTFTRPVEEVPSQYRGFLEQPGLDTFDQIMIEHLGMEELYKLYTDENREVFNQPSTIRLLIRRFKLKAKKGEIKSFEDLVRTYDTKYATVRSYSQPTGRHPQQILLQACGEGNIQAVIKGLKLYPGLRTELTYVQCWKEAALRGQTSVVWFFFDLLAEISNVGYYYSRLSLETAVRSGDLETLKHFLKLLKDREDNDDYIEYLDENLLPAFREAVAGNQDEMIEELMKEEGFETRIHDVDSDGLDVFAEAAGKSGRYEKVEFIFNLFEVDPEEAERYYDQVLKGAAYSDHLALAEKVFPLTSMDGRLEALDEATTIGSLKVARYLLMNPEWTTEELISLIPDLIKAKQDELLWKLLDSLEGEDWTLPFEAPAEMVYRKEKVFELLIVRLFSRHTPGELKYLHKTALLANNQVMVAAIEKLLREE